MNITVSVVICAAALALWIGASVAENKLVKKRRAQKQRPEVFYGRDNDFQRIDYRNDR